MSYRVFLGFSVLLIACHLTGAILRKLEATKMIRGLEAKIYKEGLLELAIFNPLNLSCKCVRVTSTFIRPAKYARVELFPPGVACKKMEIVITLKNKHKVCVDPGAKWVNNILNMIENVNGRQLSP